MNRSIVAATCALSLLLPVLMPAQEAVYKDSSAPLDARVTDLLPRLTLEEKIDLLGGTGFATKPIPRLGIPELRMTDGPLGVRWGRSTAFPAGICMASTWDTTLVNSIGAAIGREVKGHDRHVILGPCVNIARIPQGGRNFESYGEDPYLAARMAVSYIRGVQSEGVAATVKHFACNNQEYERMFVDVHVGERALQEIYLPAFKAAVQEANVLCVMNAYNKVNGHFASENDDLLIHRLKHDWGFPGLVMSDWGAVHSTIPTANGGMDLEMPFGKYLKAKTLLPAVQSGTVSEETIDAKVRRILRTEFALGLFEHPSLKDERLIGTPENREAAYRAALEGAVLLKNADGALPLTINRLHSIAVIGPDAAVCRTGGGGSSMVDPISAPSPLEILKERFGKMLTITYAAGIHLDGEAVPIGSDYLLTPDGRHGLKGEYFSNMDLQGAPAFVRTDPQVNFDFNTESPKEGFPQFNYSVRWTGTLRPEKSGKYVIDLSADDGMRLWVDDRQVIDDWSDHAVESREATLDLESGKSYQIRIEYYQRGGGAAIRFGWTLPGPDPMAAAIEAAKNSDMVLLFVGTSGAYESEGFDREDLTLPKNQDALIRDIARINKNTIVVLTCGSPVLMDGWIGDVKAVLLTWFGGQEMGRAIADLLTGVAAPSGKLPVTFPHRWEDCSAYGSYHTRDSVTEYTDGNLVGYRFADAKHIEPLFPFGYGLSYTNFEYDDVKVECAGSVADPVATVSFRVRNTGAVRGAEVAQVYVHQVNAADGRPVKELKAFRRIDLAPGEPTVVSVTLGRDAFATFDVASGTWVVPAGAYEIQIGSSSRDIRLTAPVTLK